MDKDTKTILSALETEIQAIAIYEMECKIFSLTSFTNKRKKILQLLNSILEEEKSHAFQLMKYLPKNVKPNLFKNFFLIYSGVFIGFFLSLVPGPLYFYLHVWAEEQASSIYALTKRNLKNLSPTLARDLDHSIRQEADHALRFQDLLLQLKTTSS